MININGVNVPVTMFPDNTSQVWKLPENLLKPDTTVTIQWDFSNEGEFLHLAQLKDLLDLYHVQAILSISFLPYARQDKPVGNTTTFALNTFAKLLNSLNFYEVVILDPHSKLSTLLINRSRAEFRFPYTPYLKEKIDLICYPDKGAVDKYTHSFNRRAWIYGEKVRDQLTGNITGYNLVGDPSGCNVMIIDDICDGGATFKILAKDLLAKGANKVVLYVTHGIFSKGTRTLFESGISKVFTKDGEVSERHGSIQI